MTFTIGYTPWNKGKRSPPTQCRKHKETRIVKSGSTYCRSCKNEASKEWAYRNPEKVQGYREKHRAKNYQHKTKRAS